MTKRKDKITVICRQCGTEFKAWTRTARYCEQCRLFRSREQARDYQRVRRESEKLERENLPVPPPPPKICADCGREFDPGESRRRLYCDECRKKHRRAAEHEYNTKVREKVRADYKYCPVCGKKYEPVRVGQIYCSGDCRNSVGELGWIKTWADRNPGITQAAVEAKKNGESYGEYKARLWMEKQKGGGNE